MRTHFLHIMQKRKQRTITWRRLVGYVFAMLKRPGMAHDTATARTQIGSEIADRYRTFTPVDTILKRMWIRVVCA